MSDPNWPGGPPQYPGGQPQDPSTTPSGAPGGQQPYPDPYQTPGQPAGYPYQPPTDPGQTANPYLPPTTPYGQPAAPSQPMYPYAQPGSETTQAASPFGPPTAPPSQPLYPYGQPAAPSQPMYPYAQPGQFGPPIVPPAAPKRSLKWLWITLAVVIVVLAAGSGGVVFAVQQYTAPANAALQFCGDLKAQNYSGAYGLLGTSLQSQYSSDQFTQGSQILDNVEGPVIACKQASGNAYNYSFGASSATVSAVISRAKQGDLSGTLHLTSQNGAWKVSAIDTSLLGVNLGALATAGKFCQALQAKDYSTAYGLLGSAVQSQLTQTDFQTSTTIWDQLDGPVTGCTLSALGAGNSDTAAALTVSVTRQIRGAQSGALALDLEGSAWKISQVDSNLIGTDLDPLIVGTAFCDAIVAGQFDTAYALISSDFQGVLTKADLRTAFKLPTGVRFASCTPVLSSYKVSGDSADVNIKFKLTNGNASADATLGFKLVKEGSDWKVDDFGPAS